MSEQSDNLDAINRFFSATPARNSAAQGLKDAWVAWWDTLNWYDKQIDSATYDMARNRRLDFERVNASTSTEKRAVESVAKTGLSTEQTKGEVDRRDSSGHYVVPPKPLIPEKYRTAVAAGAGAVLVLVALKKFRVI